MASSRFAELDDEEMTKILHDKDSKKTKESTDSAVRLLRKHCVSKGQPDDFENLDCESLDGLLEKFYAEVRTEIGELYKKTSFSSIR